MQEEFQQRKSESLRYWNIQVVAKSRVVHHFEPTSLQNLKKWFYYSIIIHDNETMLVHNRSSSWNVQYKLTKSQGNELRLIMLITSFSRSTFSTFFSRAMNFFSQTLTINRTELRWCKFNYVWTRYTYIQFQDFIEDRKVCYHIEDQNNKVHAFWCVSVTTSKPSHCQKIC